MLNSKTEISALTRSVVKNNHAIICPDGFVTSNIPGWINCTSTVIINEAMGAGFGQVYTALNEEGRLSGKTKASQIFFFILAGECIATIGDERRALKKGQFVYMPIKQDYLFENKDADTKILSYHKVYEPLQGYEMSPVIFGDSTKVEGQVYLNDPALRLQVLLPDSNTFDMAVNIFTYEPGGHLPFVESHVMEHGLMLLQGEGIYKLGEQWYPVKKGDSIWMGPYCSQWFAAIGKEPAVYIYYKNVNRFPTTV